MNQPTQIQPDSFAFYTAWNTGEPTIGIHVKGMDGESVLIPIDLGTAENVANVLLGHVSALESVRQTAHA